MNEHPLSVLAVDDEPPQLEDLARILRANARVADVETAAKNADIGRYFNCGQMCLGVKRVFVHESIYDAFVGQLKGILEKKTVGPVT